VQPHFQTAHHMLRTSHTHAKIPCRGLQAGIHKGRPSRVNVKAEVRMPSRTAPKSVSSSSSYSCRSTAARQQAGLQCQHAGARCNESVSTKKAGRTSARLDQKLAMKSKMRQFDCQAGIFQLTRTSCRLQWASCMILLTNSHTGTQTVPTHML
jgi:hypothetical protein